MPSYPSSIGRAIGGEPFDHLIYHFVLPYSRWQAHHRFKRAVEQALLVRGTRDFADRASYEAFLREIFAARKRRTDLGDDLRGMNETPADAHRRLPPRACREFKQSTNAHRFGLQFCHDVSGNRFVRHSRIKGALQAPSKRLALQLCLEENDMVARLTVILIIITICTGSAWTSELDVEPVFQQTPVWCWAAVGEMVFRHYGVSNINPGNNFQCGIIALLHPVCNQNCFNCVVPAGSLATMNNMLTQYPTFASGVTRTRTRLSTRVRRTRLSLTELQAEIDAGRPIVAGISPSGYNASGVSEHVALIIGYDDSDLIVNDPFPFDSSFFTGDPYESAGGEPLARGQYKIAYRNFVNQLQWRETIYGIRCTGSGCLEYGSDNDDIDDDTRDRRGDNHDEQTIQYHSCPK